MRRQIDGFIYGMLFAVFLAIEPSWCYGQVYPADFAQVLVANGIANPTAIAFVPDGRILVAEQAGKLRIIKNNALLPTPVLQLTVSSTGERGLIGVALDPNFTDNNYIFLYYTVPGSPVHNRISRFTINGDMAVSGSESIVLDLDPLSAATNHNGGAMHFGEDGKLYVAVGENANAANAQNLDTHHGKLLRINKDGSIPEGNPFPTGSEQRKRIWAYGLRNPYTFSVHPTTGRILVNDVGQNTWEEINDATMGGKNFGWPTTEGSFTQSAYPNFTNPIYTYQHGSGDGKGCALTGGTFFYPSTTNYPSSYFGKYFLQDLCNNWINSLDLSGATALRSSFATSISGSGLALSVGNDGNLYYLSRTAQALYKIIYNKTTIPYITNQPSGSTIAEGQSFTFSVAALGSTPFTYQWLKDGENLSDATNSTLTIIDATSNDGAEYKVVVSNAAGSTTSSLARLTVVQNALPVAEIVTPVAGATYTAGTNIEFSGTGVDAEDGLLPAPAFSWKINFHHDTHKHDQPSLLGVRIGSFAVPNEGETSAKVWYRIILTVTDSRGLMSSDSVDVFPLKSIIRVITDPPGLQITLDGQPFETPLEVVGVEGVLRTIGVVTPQMMGNVTHEFEAWSNGGAITQTFPVPVDDLELQATFSSVVSTEDNENKEDIVIYPNPAKQGWITIAVSSRKNQHISVRLVDLLSHQLSTLEQNLQAGNQTLVFNFGSVRAGIYSVIILVDDKVVTKKLVVSCN